MNWDKTLFFKINGLAGKGKFLDSFSVFGGRFVLYIMIILLPFSFYLVGFRNASWQWQVSNTIPLFLQFWLVSWAVSLVIGKIVKRKRPYIAYPEKVKSMFIPLFEKWKSMPSDHAMTCAVLLVVILFSRSIANVLLFFILALWVCWGRVYAGVHYPSDILVGFLVGIIVPAITIIVFNMMLSNFGII